MKKNEFVIKGLTGETVLPSFGFAKQSVGLRYFSSVSRVRMIYDSDYSVQSKLAYNETT
ncbi:MAG: hypothetical protein JNL95_07870 [Chitinophagales bacterium]|nr:hypothetical protein [Chitinophagales bacterium]